MVVVAHLVRAPDFGTGDLISSRVLKNSFTFNRFTNIFFLTLYPCKNLSESYLKARFKMES